MSELRDYQRVLIDNIASDIDDIFCEHRGEHLDAIIDDVRLKLESRIETYDRERWEQIERDLPKAMLRALESIKC